MANKKDALGDRMKGYENITRNYLTRRVPAIIRLDDKVFRWSMLDGELNYRWF